MSWKKNGLIGAAIAAVLAAIVVVLVIVQANRDTTGETGDKPGDAQSSSTTTPSGTATSEPGVPVGAADDFGLGMGDPDAPVKVEVFEDFLCPFCRQLEAASRTALGKAAQDGKAHVVYRPIAFLNEYSTRSLNAFAVVLDKSGGEAALKFHDLLYENQPSESGTMPDDEWLIDLAVKAGADEAAIRPGIENMAFQQWIVNGTDDASKRGITGTPSVFVNGERVDGSTIEELAQNAETQIEEGN